MRTTRVGKKVQLHLIEIKKNQVVRDIKQEVF